MDITDYSSPVQVVGKHSYIQIKASNSSSLALKADGSIWAWGNNTVGQLGNNTIINTSYPIELTTLDINTGINYISGNNNADIDTIFE